MKKEENAHKQRTYKTVMPNYFIFIDKNKNLAKVHISHFQLFH